MIKHAGGYGGDPRTDGDAKDPQGNYLDPLMPHHGYRGGGKLLHQDSPATKEAIARWRLAGLPTRCTPDRRLPGCTAPGPGHRCPTGPGMNCIWLGSNG